MKRVEIGLFALVFSLLLSPTAFGTLMYATGDQWDFSQNFSGATNQVTDWQGNIVWTYSGGKSTDTPSKVTTLGNWAGTLNGGNGAWRGSDTEDYGWIGQGVIHAASDLTIGSQRTPFLEWISPFDGMIRIDIQVTDADLKYQAGVFLNDYVLQSQFGSAQDYSYTGTIHVGIGDTVTLRIKQDVPLEDPTVHAGFLVTVVPEPATVGLMVLGIGWIPLKRRTA